MSRNSAASSRESSPKRPTSSRSIPGERRELRSDLLLVRSNTLPRWLQFRDTFEVDGPRCPRPRGPRLTACSFSLRRRRRTRPSGLPPKAAATTWACLRTDQRAADAAGVPRARRAAAVPLLASRQSRAPRGAGPGARGILSSRRRYGSSGSRNATVRPSSATPSTDATCRAEGRFWIEPLSRPRADERDAREPPVGPR